MSWLQPFRDLSSCTARGKIREFLFTLAVILGSFAVPEDAAAQRAQSVRPTYEGKYATYWQGNGIKWILVLDLHETAGRVIGTADSYYLEDGMLRYLRAKSDYPSSITTDVNPNGLFQTIVGQAPSQIANVGWCQDNLQEICGDGYSRKTNAWVKLRFTKDLVTQLTALTQ